MLSEGRIASEKWRGRCLLSYRRAVSRQIRWRHSQGGTSYQMDSELSALRRVPGLGSAENPWEIPFLEYISSLLLELLLRAALFHATVPTCLTHRYGCFSIAARDCRIACQ